MWGNELTRREVLTAAGVTVALPLAGLAADSDTVKVPFPKDGADALLRLKEGNARFAESKTRHAHESANWRKQLVSSQKPFATILGCSDSRVPVELIFDQGFGDLFVVRVAGNVIAPDVVGSLGYAIEHLETPLVLVVGHRGCGAVTAAVQALDGKLDPLPGVNALVELITPGLPKPKPDLSLEQRIDNAVEANVLWSMKQLAKLPGAKKVLESGQVTLAGAVYDLATGRVRFL